MSSPFNESNYKALLEGLEIAEIFISEGSPALSVHIGRGGAAIAIMGG